MAAWSIRGAIWFDNTVGNNVYEFARETSHWESQHGKRFCKSKSNITDNQCNTIDSKHVETTEKGISMKT